MMNFFNLTLPEKHFIFPSILNDSFAGYSNLGCRSLRLILGNVIMMKKEKNPVSCYNIVNLEDVMLSEISQSLKDKNCGFPLI